MRWMRSMPLLVLILLVIGVVTAAQTKRPVTSSRSSWETRERPGLSEPAVSGGGSLGSDGHSGQGGSLLYEDFGRLQRLAGATVQADALDAKRRSL